ncbi:hypothetical protein Halhy_2421 [Haliscomenobacter hydrossis DSM 1100]|uniref:Uncharacterized protein n=1 Tax=Haliscomenobacter hydrossis (strain ATCC 27775 / DSM 1100 / LMG 10767 / O) TaxID=760192 RepID=F4KWE5_HALH1|nr:hypothetical protein Halhy_2421 [Haliscomenobacter hydrossis DSM 1100]
MEKIYPFYQHLVDGVAFSKSVVPEAPFIVITDDTQLGR